MCLCNNTIKRIRCCMMINLLLRRKLDMYDCVSIYVKIIVNTFINGVDLSGSNSRRLS